MISSTQRFRLIHHAVDLQLNWPKSLCSHRKDVHLFVRSSIWGSGTCAPMMVRQITHIKMDKYNMSAPCSFQHKCKVWWSYDVPPTGLFKAPLRAEGKCKRQAVMPVNIIFSFSRQRPSVLLDQPLVNNQRVSPAHSSRPKNKVWSGGGVLISVSISSPLCH